MGLLDKLKPQPRWKHVDPAVRLDAIRELDDPAELALLAESDQDPKVRRAAILVTSDPAVLGRIARADGDDDVRDRAADRLVTLASRNAPDADTAAASIALEAVRVLTDPRRLSTIAKSDASDGVRTEALARITDERALGSVARHAKQESTASAALGRLTGAEELLDVALHAENRDVALAAFERMATADMDTAQLRSVEVRARQKNVSRRARALIQEREVAEAARQTAALERQRRESMLCQAVEHLVELSDVSTGRAELARLTESWRALGASDAAALDRFAQASTAAEAAFVRRERGPRRPRTVSARARKPSPPVSRSASVSRRWTATMCWRNWFQLKRNGGRFFRSSATARRPTDWENDLPGRSPRAVSGTRWARSWSRHERRSRRS